jgi:N-methylhydantoinase B
MTLDPITFEIIRHRLDSINDEAASTLQHVSGSQIAVESNDLNTAVTAADGRVVACGRYILAQVASIHLVVADILTEYQDNPGIGPGDQFLTNDPYVGTLHQPDVVLVAPVFASERLIGWVGSTVHQADVGGPTPGGMSMDARSIWDEPIPMPPVKIVEGDRIRRDLEREYLIRSRTPQLNALDLAGQVAANRASVAALLRLCERYGADQVEGAMARLLTGTERRIRERLAELPDGRWRHVAHLEYGPEPDGSPGGAVYAVRLTATKRGEQLELDFSESSDQAAGAINTAYPALAGFTMAAVLVYLCGGLPWVPGALWPAVRIVSRKGSVVDAEWPAGVAMSTATVAQAVRTCVNVCLARMLDGSAHDEHVMAGCQLAGAGGVVLSGHTDDGRMFAGMTLDEVAGGGGARTFADGADSSGPTTSPGGACANVEVNESYLPVRYLVRAELPDSAGPGRLRGGVGSLHLLTPHEVRAPVGVLSFAQGLQHPGAMGLAGGEPGGSGAFAILGPDEARALVHGELGPRELPIPGPDARLTASDVHVAVSQGGGGYGDPIERDPAAVLEDVLDSLVSRERAASDYAVLLADTASGPVVDGAGTAALRDERRRARLGGSEPRPVAKTSGGRRLSATLRLDEDGESPVITCNRCAIALCDAAKNVYAHLLLDEQPARTFAPFRFGYDGAERFTVRRFYCPGCGLQIDAIPARSGEPLVYAVEPLLHAIEPA